MAKAIVPHLMARETNSSQNERSEEHKRGAAASAGHSPSISAARRPVTLAPSSTQHSGQPNTSPTRRRSNPSISVRYAPSSRRAAVRLLETPARRDVLHTTIRPRGPRRQKTPFLVHAGRGHGSSSWRTTTATICDAPSRRMIWMN